MSAQAQPTLLLDSRPETSEFLDDVCQGLSRQPKRLSSKYFYDSEGSKLFERICEQPEYYLTRSELTIMREHVGAMADCLGSEVLLMEFGSGSGQKTRLLLEALQAPVAYVPVEISHTALLDSVAGLAKDFPRLDMLPVCADFTQTFQTPLSRIPARRTVVYFPGSTLGNFESNHALRLLRQMRDIMGCHGGALIGIDLKKDSSLLEAAYNDAAGVTAAFTLNMLAHFNRELGADFHPGQFRHYAHYNALAGRIETYIVSTVEQKVHLDGETFSFAADEALLVEYSYKYSSQGFASLAAEAGLKVEHVWLDPAQYFSVQYLVPTST